MPPESCRTVSCDPAERTLTQIAATKSRRQQAHRYGPFAGDTAGHAARTSSDDDPRAPAKSGAGPSELGVWGRDTR